MNNKTYDILKTIGTSLPLVATFVLVLKDAWGIPYAEPIAATICGLSTLLLDILGEISKQYFKDRLVIEANKGIADPEDK